MYILFLCKGETVTKVKRLLDRMVLYLGKVTRPNILHCSSVEASSSLSSTLLVLSSQDGGSRPSRNKDDAFHLLDDNLLPSNTTQKLSHDALLSDKFTEHGRTLTLKDDVQGKLQKIMDVIRLQHEDMKNHFQTQTTEIRNDIESKLQSQQYDLGNRISKTEEMIHKIKKEVKL